MNENEEIIKFKYKLMYHLAEFLVIIKHSMILISFSWTI